MPEPVFHCSHEAAITRFEPRLPPSLAGGLSPEDKVVWAIGARLLHNYPLPGARFTTLLSGADYYVCREAVEPLGVTCYEDLLGELVRRGVEVRITPSLWKLHHAVVQSSLAFSGIRLRNAMVREEDKALAEFYLGRHK
jgi:hypothetical protein